MDVNVNVDVVDDIQMSLTVDRQTWAVSLPRVPAIGEHINHGPYSVGMTTAGLPIIIRDRKEVEITKVEGPLEQSAPKWVLEGTTVGPAND